jgi:hypothetical protein
MLDITNNNQHYRKEFLMTDNTITQFIRLFISVDDFCLKFESGYNRRLLRYGIRKRIRKRKLALSEVMTIVIWFHMSGYRTFKDYYIREVITHLRWAFPDLVSYNRFVELMPDALLPMCFYFRTRKGRCSGISFVDSMPIAVCHNRRIHSHRVFEHSAKRGRTTMGWFYGFKVHLIVNDQGEILTFRFTPGNTDDREPVPDMVKGLSGKLFGDKGYISQKLFELLFADGIQLITRLKRNMKNRLMPLFDKLMLRKRAIIESIHDQLKNISQIEHTRHRSPVNFLVNVISAIVAYTHREKKPSLNIRASGFAGLPAIVV